MFLKNIKRLTARYQYVCMKSNCGYVELTNYAPSANKRCPECGGMMAREAA